MPHRAVFSLEFFMIFVTYWKRKQFRQDFPYRTPPPSPWTKFHTSLSSRPLTNQTIRRNPFVGKLNKSKMPPKFTFTFSSHGFRTPTSSPGIHTVGKYSASVPSVINFKTNISLASSYEYSIQNVISLIPVPLLSILRHLFYPSDLSAFDFSEALFLNECH